VLHPQELIILRIGNSLQPRRALNIKLFNDGAEGPGSLLSLLKSKGRGRSITAGCGDNGLEINSMVFLFTLTIALTIHGAENV